MTVPGYTPWTVTAGEQPTTAYWNILGSNDAAFNTALTAGGVIYTSLLATIFSGESTSYTNGGSAGGTFSYVNIGGIKLLYGTTATLANASGVNQYTIDFPASFFNSVIGQVAFISSLTVTQAQQCSGQQGNNTSSMIVNVFNGAASATANLGVIVIGT